MNGNFFTLDEFNDAKRKIEPVFCVERRLPDQVFKRSYQFHLLCEFNFAMDDLQQALEKTRSPLADETVLSCALDPDPITFYDKEFHKIYGFYFKANFSLAEYLHMLWVEVCPGDEPSEFLFTEVEVYLPESASWAMWGERSRDIAAIGLDDPALAAFLVNETGYCMDADTALGSFAKLPFAGQKVPEDFRRALTANYGSRDDLEKKLGRKVRHAGRSSNRRPPPRRTST
jgi:hypothetical protein